MDTQSEQQQSLEEIFRDAPPPEWLVDMIAYHQKTGCYRPEDLYRLLGDPCKGVTVHPDGSIS